MAPVPSQQVLALCRQYGAQLNVPPSIDGVALMAAFAQNESTFGANVTPRHEPAYDSGGHYDRAEQSLLLDKYGSAAAYSYGPWQTLPCNAMKFSPDTLFADPNAAAQAFVGDFNHRVAPHAQTIDAMAQIYNGGHVSATPLAGVARYAADLQKNYELWLANLKNEAADATPVA